MSSLSMSFWAFDIVYFPGRSYTSSNRCIYFYLMKDGCRENLDLDCNFSDRLALLHLQTRSRDRSCNCAVLGNACPQDSADQHPSLTSSLHRHLDFLTRIGIHLCTH